MPMHKKRKRTKKSAAPPPKKEKSDEPKETLRERGTPISVPRQEESELPEGASIPPHSVFLHVVMNKLFVKVPLHHIPASCINFEPTSTKFHLDTMKFARRRHFLEYEFTMRLRIFSYLILLDFPILMESQLIRKMRRLLLR